MRVSAPELYECQGKKNPSAVKMVASRVKQVLRRCAYNLTYGQHVFIIVLTHDSIVSSLAELALSFVGSGKWRLTQAIVL